MNEAEQVKLCKDCKHFLVETNQATLKRDVYLCDRDRSGIDLVTGERFLSQIRCRQERLDVDGCWFVGRFWEAK